MYVINTFHSDFFAVYYPWSDLSFDDSQRFLQIHIHTFVLKRNKHYFNKEQLNKFYRELHISFSAKKHQPKRRNSIFFDKRLLFFAKTTRQSPSKRKVADNIYRERKEEKPQDDLKNISFDNSAQNILSWWWFAIGSVRRESK